MKTRCGFAHPECALPDEPNQLLLPSEREFARLRAEVADLKARLKAARMSYLGTRSERIAAGADFDEDNGEDFDAALARVTDLRVKNWRKP